MILSIQTNWTAYKKIAFHISPIDILKKKAFHGYFNNLPFPPSLIPDNPIKILNITIMIVNKVSKLRAHQHPKHHSPNKNLHLVLNINQTTYRVEQHNEE